MKTIITTLAALCVAFAAASGFADEGMKTRQLVVGNPYDNQLAYFSPRPGARLPGYRQLAVSSPYVNIQTYFSPTLKAHFAIHTEYPSVSVRKPFQAARLLSHPESWSPLAQLGIRQGDLIARLNGVSVSNLEELEKHSFETTVRFFRGGPRVEQEGKIMIFPNYALQYLKPTVDVSGSGFRAR
jgi:hypothetical protein